MLDQQARAAVAPAFRVQAKVPCGKTSEAPTFLCHHGQFARDNAGATEDLRSHPLTSNWRDSDTNV
jgi:hypothetical protein